jgi:hypothetical protein
MRARYGCERRIVVPNGFEPEDDAGAADAARFSTRRDSHSSTPAR